MRTHVGQSAEELLDFSFNLHSWHKEQQGSERPSNDAPALYLVQSAAHPRRDASQRQTIRSQRVREESTIGSKFSCPTGESFSHF